MAISAVQAQLLLLQAWPIWPEMGCGILCAQMGGAEGVRRAEQYTLVTGIAGGMYMHALPRLAQLEL